MGKVSETGSVSNVEDTKELSRFVSIALKNIISQINGNLTFSDNISFKVFSVSFPAAATSYTFAHGLGRAPLIWISGDQTADASIFQSKASDSTNVYLQASAICDAKILVI